MAIFLTALADRIPDDDRSLDARGVAFVMSFAGFAFAGFVILVYTLQRLGMPDNLSASLLAAWIVLSVLLASWLGRSVSGPRFFFAARKADAISVGIGGASCWLSGALIAVFFALPNGDGFILIAALLLGLALQTFLMAAPINVSGASSVPGLLIRRFGNRYVGFVCLVAYALVLCPLALAELEVAVRLFGVLSGFGTVKSVWIVCGLALLPIMFGGWQAFLLVNACVGIWILFSMLSPALLIGFFPFLLDGNAQSGGAVLEPLRISQSTALINSGTPLTAATALLVYAAGFAALPQTIARSSLMSSRIAAVEGQGWTGLVVFLSLSALLLSIGLIINSGAQSTLGKLLQSSGIISALPYAAIFLAAFNALSVTLFTAAITVVRAIGADGNREPGVGSMFAVRLLAIILAGALLYTRDYADVALARLVLSALAIAAAGLFPVLIFSLWSSKPTALFATSAMVCGTGGACAAFYYGSFDIA
ncbi:MAG: hypothetical protein ACR2PF_08480, partial [Rhizobiaceae bacterium]